MVLLSNLYTTILYAKFKKNNKPRKIFSQVKYHNTKRRQDDIRNSSVQTD